MEGLINEAFLRLVDQHRVHWSNRAHSFAIASQSMRGILVDTPATIAPSSAVVAPKHLTVSGVPAADSAPDIDLL